MAVSVEEAIKIGFLTKCAEDGLSMQETHARVKQAIARLKSNNLEKMAFVSEVISALSNVAGLGLSAAKAVPSVLGAGALTAIAAPILTGAGLGYGAAKLTTSDNKDKLEEAKQDEIVGEYERLGEEAKRRALLKRILSQTGKRIVPLSPSLGV